MFALKRLLVVLCLLMVLPAAAQPIILNSGTALGNDTGANRPAKPVTISGVATSVAALKAMVGGGFSSVLVLSYYGNTDYSSGGYFVWNAASVAVGNGGTIIQPNAGGTGRWIRQLETPVYTPEMFGCVGDGVTNDTSCLSAAVTAANSVINVELSGKTYCVDPIKFGDGGLPVPPKFGGVGGSIATLKACGVSASPTVTYSKFDISSQTGVHDLYIDANSKHANALLVHGCQMCTFEKIRTGFATSDNVVVHGEPNYNVQYSSFRDITSRDAGRHAYRFYSDNNAGDYYVAANVYSGLRGQRAVGDCYNIDYATVDPVGSEAESCTGYGVNLDHTKGGTWVGVQVEGNGAGGLNGTANTTNMRFLGGRLIDSINAIFTSGATHYIDSVDSLGARIYWAGTTFGQDASFVGGLMVGAGAANPGLGGINAGSYYQSGTLTKNVAETLTNKTISGASNTLSNIASASLSNTAVTAGSYGSATASPTYTVNAEGQLTAAANVTITPAISSVTGLGTGIAAALAVNTGSAGAPVLFNGAGGTPSSITLTNATGVPYAALPSLSANQLLGSLTATTPSGQSVPSCSTAGSALRWTSGTGFDCNTSITAAAVPASGITGQVALANGGTAANLTASNGGIFYSTASAGAILSGTATARQMLQSGASAAPAWSTATWPATTAINRLLYSSAANVVSDLATANSSILVTDGSGVPSLGTAAPNGVTATTQTVDDSTTKLATDAFVVNQAAAATPLASTTAGAVGTSVRYARADHVHPASSTNDNMCFSSGNNIAITQNSTFFFTYGYLAGTESVVSVPLSAPATIKNLYASTNAAPAAGQTFTLTISKNASAQALTCAITSAGSTCNDTTHTFTVVAGDLVAVKIVTSATSGTANGMNACMTVVTTSP